MYLLDTHTFFWWLDDNPALSKIAKDLIQSTEKKFVSAASVWELETKFRIGKLPEAKPLIGRCSELIQLEGFTELAITVSHAQRAGSWETAHKDPFDRMLAAQAEIENLSLISKVVAFDGFPVKRIW